jgi:hypothetical protein
MEGLEFFSIIWAFLQGHHTEYKQVLGDLTTNAHISCKCAQYEDVYVCCDSKLCNPVLSVP